jgi:c-di-GMP-related signal transduction protein
MTPITPPRQDQPASRGAGAISAPRIAPTRYLGRQPILDSHSRLFAYELLFRSGTADAFSGDPEQATREVVDHWLMLIPEPEEALAFVNCTRQALMDGTANLLPPANTVLEILETIEPDAELIERCRSLKAEGYRIALDDFVPDPAWAPLVEFADFIKIDFRNSDVKERQEIYRMARRGPARLLAEKVETEEEMRLGLSEGCSLFQGYFFSRPVILTSRAVPQNHLVYVSLLAALQKIPADIRELERLVLSDTSLCYRILRLANSAIHGHRGTVTTVRGALIMVGDDAVRRMVTVALAGVLAEERSEALVSMALARGRFCELLAPALSLAPQQLYLIGMLSLLDVLLVTPMTRILQALPLAEEMKAALLREASPFGPALDLVRSLESCDWAACERLRQSLSLSESSTSALYVESLRWASSMVHPEIHCHPADRRPSL